MTIAKNVPTSPTDVKIPMVPKSVKVRYRLDIPDSQMYVFVLDETKSWKGKLLRGHDVAEMIVEDVWKTQGITMAVLYIDGPMPYTGTYEIQTKFEPTFTATRVKETVSGE